MKRRVTEITALIATLFVAMVVVSACGSSDDNKSTTTGPDVNAQGEGKLNIVDWEGYTDPSFVKPFEKQTGCQVKSTYAGSSDEMFTKFRSGGGGQYDLASFSGDASLRAIKSGSVAQLDTSKLPNLEKHGAAAAGTVVQHGRRQALRPLVRVGRQRPDRQCRQGQTAPRLLGSALRQGEQGQDPRSRTTRFRSPTRRFSSSTSRIRTRSARTRSPGDRQAQGAEAAGAQVLGSGDRLRGSCSSRATRRWARDGR